MLNPALRLAQLKPSPIRMLSVGASTSSPPATSAMRRNASPPMPWRWNWPDACIACMAWSWSRWTSADHAELDVEGLGHGPGELLQRHSWFKGELILELGRFLAASCGIYLARVVRMKESCGTRFAILEGGINHLLRPLSTGEPFPVATIGKSGPLLRTILAGPLCTSLDRLGEVDLPENLAPGDLLAFGRVGAYGFSEGMTNFLSHPLPPEIWVA